LECVFRSFSSSNIENTFRSFYSKPKKSEKTFRNFYSRAKMEIGGGEKFGPSFFFLVHR
jgi:hypothetical protein